MFMLFTEEDSAEEHCQFGALIFFNQEVFGWLDVVLDKNQVSVATSNYYPSCKEIVVSFVREESLIC
ncbi:hypothetical protein V7306_11470 [Neobacillus vireti]